MFSFDKFIIFQIYPIMGDKMLELQQQVRNNSDELQDYLRDLGSWVTQMENKDEQLKRKKVESKSNFEVPRSVDELKRKSQFKETMSSQNGNQLQQKNKKKKVTTHSPESGVKTGDDKIHAFDYDAWSKFDVEKALNEIDKKEEHMQDSELMDMDADMRLQRAIVEKDRGNEFFKVCIY